VGLPHFSVKCVQEFPDFGAGHVRRGARSGHFVEVLDAVGLQTQIRSQYAMKFAL
jgi:hypothetical protein